MTVKKKSIVSSLLWAFLDQFSSKGISIIVSIILAHLLVPEEFGLISLVYLFAIIAQELSDGGLGASLIRSKNTSYKDYSTIFITNVFIASVLYILCYVAAPYISTFYNQPNLKLLIRVYCLLFVIGSFSSIHISLLIKNMEFRKIMYINMPSTFIGATVAISLAIMNYGVWSIAAMPLVTQSMIAILLWSSSKKFKWYFSFQILKRHYNFGLKIMLTSLLSNGLKNITSSVIGKVYTLTDLGYYDRSKILSAYPSTVFVGILYRVFYPFFSAITDEKKLIEGYKKVIRLSFYCSVFIMVLLISVSKPFIEIALGSKWLPILPYFQLLCLTSIMVPVNTFNLNILKVKGLSNSILKIEAINVAITLTCIIIGVFFTILGLIYCLLIAEVLIFIHNAYKTQQYHQYKIRQQIFDFIPTIIIGLLSYFSVVYINFSNVFYEFIAQSSLFVIIFLLLSYVFKNYSFNFLLNLLISKVKKRI